MPISGMSLPIGATLTPTGGTAKTYSLSGPTIPNGIIVADTSVTDFRVRPSIAFTSKLPKLIKAGQYSLGRLKIYCKMPRVHPNDATLFLPEYWSFEMGYSPIGTPQNAAMASMASILLSDSDATAFIATGSLT